MINIAKAFDHGKAFIGFITGGDPDLETSKQCILEMARAGADLIEIGIPFSDPIAEGVVIQAADLRALNGGMTTDKAFELAEEVLKETQIPMVFMTYLNVVFKYGYEKFFSRCQQIGMAGVIIPDMPYEEKGEADEIASKYGVDVISLIAPTSEERIKTIAADAKGFIYVVSSMGVTGMRSEIKTDLKSIVGEIKKVTNLPAAVGFGINTPEQAANIAAYSDGIIVGSAIVKIIEKYGKDSPEHVYEYVKSMKDAIRDL